MSRLPKKEFEFYSRMEIIHNNLFRYLKERKITQKKFANDNDIPESTVSKWKNNTICMSEEHIIKAANYLGIYVNDLYYNDNEKKEIEVLSSKQYDPIMAQKQVKINKILLLFSNPIETISVGLMGFLIIMTIFIFISKDNHWYWSFLSIIPVMTFSKDIYDKYHIEETYLINYLDDMFYSIKNTKNQFRYRNIVLTTISFLSLVLMIILLINGMRQNDAYELKIMLLFMTLIILIINIVSGIYSSINLKEQIYHYELTPYFIVIANVIITLVYSSFSIWLIFSNLSINWYYLIPIMVLLITNGFIYYNVSIKYREYRLIYYDSKDKNNKELYKK